MHDASSTLNPVNREVLAVKRRSVIGDTPWEAMEGMRILRQTMEDDEKHDAEFRSAPGGQEAFRLREQARALVEGGRPAAAIPLLQQALLHLNQETDTVALAAIRHDLAKSVGDDGLGHANRRYYARDLLEKAVASPARRRYPRRWTISASLLASHLRRLASGERDETAKAIQLDRAEALYWEAADVAERCQAFWDATGYWFNLGNLLMQQRDDTEGAIEAYERSLECLEPFAEAQEFKEKPDLTYLLINLAGALHDRNHGQDRARALNLLRRAVRLEHPGASNQARLSLSHMLDKQGHREEAVRHLRRVSLRELRHHELVHAVEMFEQFGLAGDAKRQMEQLVQERIHERSATIADIHADRAARLVQRTALVLAQLHLRQGRAVAAFLALDNCSGLRFAEDTNFYTCHPRDPINRGLRARDLREGGTAGILDDLLDRLKAMKPEFWRRAITDVLAAFNGARTPEEVSSVADMKAALQQALAGPTIRLEPLQQSRARAGNRVMRIRTLLGMRDPAFDRSHGPLAEDLTEAELAKLLAADPDQVFIRFAFDPEYKLIAVAAFPERGAVRALHLSLDLPRDLFELLDEHEAEPQRTDQAARLSAYLAALDLSPVLPSGRHRRVVLLPTSLLARLPLAALGPPGARLLDRFESVIWLPSLYPLRTRQDVHPPRSGTLTVIPGRRGNTRLHGAAAGRALLDEVRLEEAAATVAAVSARASQVDVVCFYAHGEYRHGGERPHDEDIPFGPVISLADEERITLRSLKDQWHGVERVELWCCRTGVQLPMDPLGTLVDEAFGLDYQFLLFGARSAIGSLREVPEFVTAWIVDEYRRRLLDRVDAATALADAQRGWIYRGLPRLIELLRSHPEDAVPRFVAEWGVNLSASARAASDALSSPAVPEDIATSWQTLWSCPTAWAAFRFVGVPERRPKEAWRAEYARPLTPEEERRVDALVDGPARKI